MSDLISRRAAIDALNKLDVSDGVGISSVACHLQEKAIRSIENLPSVQPEHGYWIESHEHIYIANGVIKEWTNWYCSECDAPNDKPTNFCPNCGVKMER